MDPDVGLGIEHEAAGDTPPRSRPAVFLRLMEIIGLGLVIYGLADHRLGLVAICGVLILGSYALYRRKHGPAQSGGSGTGPGGMGSDGGGD